MLIQLSSLIVILAEKYRDPVFLLPYRASRTQLFDTVPFSAADCRQLAAGEHLVVEGQARVDDCNAELLQEALTFLGRY